MKEVKKDSIITFTYQISIKGEGMVEEIKEPMKMRLGKNHILPALEKLMIGMKEGETRHGMLLPSQGFGEYKEDLIKTLPKENFPPEVKKGDILKTLHENKTLSGIITEVNKKEVVINLNHKYAGQHLFWTLEVIKIED